MSLLLPLIALCPLVGAAALAPVGNRHRRAAAWIGGAATIVAFAAVLAALPAILDGQVLRWSIDWLPVLGLRFGFRMDGLAWLFCLLIAGIGSLVVLYASYYLSRDDPPARFFLFLMLFMGAMMGVVLADNLILLVVFWEATSLSSFLLIGYWQHSTDARRGARMALTITGMGGLCLLAGVLLIGHIVGSTDLDTVLRAGDVVRGHPLYLPALALVLLGCFTKSAQFPFHFWLPHAMAAPTPVSAYLHSATMVKAGVFLLARLYPTLGGSEPWFWIVSVTGLATLVLAAWIALFQHDLKGLLAYSTISHLGLITLLFGLDEPLAVIAGVFHILNHATFKASLFMAAGIIDHESGSRDMRKLNGLWKYMPRTALLAMVASGAMAGVPLLNGFLSKEMFFAEAVHKSTAEWMQWVLPAGATLAGMFAVAYSMRFIHDVFFNGEPVGLPKTPHEPPRFMRVPVELLVLLCLVVGLAPALTIGPILAIGAKGALFGGFEGTLPAYTLAIWHGLNLPLAMSALALVGGVAVYFWLQRRLDLHTVERAPVTPQRSGRMLFDDALAGGRSLANRATRQLQKDQLQRYLLVLLLVALAAGALPFVGDTPAPFSAAAARSTDAAAAAAPGPATTFGFVVIWLVGVAAIVATVRFHANRLLALLLIGAVGLVVSLAFVYLSAPDLALTQLLVELATIALMMLALRWLPPESDRATRGSAVRRGRDALLALAVGAGVAGLTWAVLSMPLAPISTYFLETAKSLGGGSNVVNVILVDYRGYDTLGEITVLGIAALVIDALLAPRHGSSPPGMPAAHPVAPIGPSAGHPLMLALVARLLLPLAAMVSIYLFLRGHNLPGGGFIAGLVLAIALIMQYVANGQGFVERRLHADYVRWIGAGLTVAGATGLGAWFFDAPFLTSTYDYPLAPLIGEVPLASAAVFDLGVFVTVVGATMLALSSVARADVAAIARRAP
ncbi:MAG: monovalent cation/H+ antiporter subunit A [Lautropia sp.]